MRRLFIADLCVSTLAVLAVLAGDGGGDGGGVGCVLTCRVPAKKRRRMWRPWEKRGAENGAPGKKRRRKKWRPSRLCCFLR